MMNGFRAYRYYLATKLHFTKDNYDVFEKRGSVKGSEAAFMARNDRHIFNKLARNYDTDREIIQYFVANFAYRNEGFLYEESSGSDAYTKWIKNKQSITQMFVDDLSKMLNTVETNKQQGACLFEWDGVEYPLALTMFIGNQINVETLRIIDDIFPFLTKWTNKGIITEIWSDEFRVIKKLVGFVKYDQSKILTVWHKFKHELDEL